MILAILNFPPRYQDLLDKDLIKKRVKPVRVIVTYYKVSYEL